MYAVMFPTGKTLVFHIRAVAETYVVAYRGVLISDVISTTTKGHPVTATAKKEMI